MFTVIEVEEMFCPSTQRAQSVVLPKLPAVDSSDVYLGEYRGEITPSDFVSRWETKRRKELDKNKKNFILAMSAPLMMLLLESSFIAVIRLLVRARAVAFTQLTQSQAVDGSRHTAGWEEFLHH